MKENESGDLFIERVNVDFVILDAGADAIEGATQLRFDALSGGERAKARLNLHGGAVSLRFLRPFVALLTDLGEKALSTSLEVFKKALKIRSNW